MISHEWRKGLQPTHSDENGPSRHPREGGGPASWIPAFAGMTRKERPPKEHTPGKVYIVGAGPGAHDLITLRGLRALRLADVVFYDALVSPELLAEAPSADLIFVGKRCGRHPVEQHETVRMMIERARRGDIVVRLKGGDPMIYGRGGEEALACNEALIEYEIIPGVCSALGAASFAGIPLTHRGVASSVAFVTAHSAACLGKPDLSWGHLVKAVDTLVIFMGGSWLEPIASALVGFGLPPETAAAVVSHATHENQQTVVGSLRDIAQRVKEAHLATPVLIIVGAVAEFGETLNWFERQRLVASCTAAEDFPTSAL